jgi:hypothetical protein
MMSANQPTATDIRHAIQKVLSVPRPTHLDMPEVSREGDNHRLGLVIREGPSLFRCCAGWNTSYAFAEGEQRWSLLRSVCGQIDTRWYSEFAGRTFLGKAFSLCRPEPIAARYMWTEQWLLRTPMLDDDDVLQQELSRPDVDESPRAVALLSVYYFETKGGVGYLSRMAVDEDGPEHCGVWFPEGAP